MTAVWREPRSHGRNKAATPLPGRSPSISVPHRPVGASGFAPVWALSTFPSSCAVVRAWCLESAALLLAAVLGERARCVRRAVLRRACACRCPVATAVAAAACALRLSRCLACVQCNGGGGSAYPSCKRGVALLRGRRACGPPVPCQARGVFWNWRCGNPT